MSFLPGAVFALATLVLLSCQSPPRGPDFGAGESAPSAVLVAPLNLAIRPAEGFEADTRPVWEALIAHLDARGLDSIALDASRSAVLWEEVVASSREAGGARDLRAAWSRFARRADAISGRAGGGPEPRWVVLPSLLIRSASVRGNGASWDGVHRDFRIPFSLDYGARSHLDSPWGADFTGYRGALAAASLHVAVLTADGRLVWEGLGGLSLVQEIDPLASGENDTWRFQLRSDPFAEAAQLREGVALAFARPFSTLGRPPRVAATADERTPPPASAR